VMSLFMIFGTGNFNITLPVKITAININCIYFYSAHIFYFFGFRPHGT
jgi:hypothetical protein